MLSVLEYHDIGSTARGSIAIPLEPPNNEQALEVGSSSVQSEPFKPNTCLIKIMSDEDCQVAVGIYPDATGASRKVKAGVEQTLSVPIGGNFRIAVMATSGSVTGMDSLEALVRLLASPADAQKQFAIMQDQVAKFTAAAAELKKAGDDNKALLQKSTQAMQDALNTKDAADKANTALAARESTLARDIQTHAEKVKAFQAAADARTKALDDREAAHVDNVADLNKKGSVLADTASNLDAREKDLAAREAKVAAAAADYEARIAKLKALAS